MECIQCSAVMTSTYDDSANDSIFSFPFSIFNTGDYFKKSLKIPKG
jgi:hypothetical protein